MSSSKIIFVLSFIRVRKCNIFKSHERGTAQGTQTVFVGPEFFVADVSLNNVLPVCCAVQCRV